MSKRKTLEGFSKDRSGVATIEFVVTLPLFLAALAFAFEFGQFFLAHQSTVNNVRSAARYLSRLPTFLSDDDRDIAIARAQAIIRSGKPDISATGPSYLANVCVSPMPTCITFPSTNVIRLDVRVEYPLTLFGFIDGGQHANMPFVVREDVRRFRM